MSNSATNVGLGIVDALAPALSRFKGQRWFVAAAMAMWISWPLVALAQNAQLSGNVRDQHGGAIAEATITLVEAATGAVLTTQSNERGVYTFASVRPGTYELDVAADGFGAFRRPALALSVDQRAVINVNLEIAGRTEEVKVAESRPLLGTNDGSVGTVIDRRLAAELPVRGRSFTALVALAPGVSRLSSSSDSASSEFRVNGQRDSSNALTVDGVAAPSELGAGRGLVNGGGQRFARTVTGGINGGVSMDAVQEVRVQTSTFAAEFGRTPGAQISLVTRSGTNLFSGSVFEQFRNQRLMANDWFANSRGDGKPEIDEHQFGGTLGGPVIANRLFFFGSYEGLRLDQPVFVHADVPSNEARDAMPVGLRDVVAAYPRPTGPTRADLTAEYAAYAPLRHSADTFGLRVDHVASARVRLFGRYGGAPSTIDDGSPLATNSTTEKRAHNVTLGATATLGSRASLDVRVNYARAIDGYIGPQAAALSGWLPDAATGAEIDFVANNLSSIYRGETETWRQRQSNAVASLSYLYSAHHIKVGIDHRRLSPRDLGNRSLQITFDSVEEMIRGESVSNVRVFREFPNRATFQNTSLFAQDDWKVGPSVSVTYGVRWDVNPAPSFAVGEGPLAVERFDPIEQLALSNRTNVPLWRTDRGNVFPRLGASWTLDRNGRTVLSGGIGVFGDLGAVAAGSAARFAAGNSTELNVSSVRLPLSDDDVAGIAERQLEPPYRGTVYVVDPNLGTPKTTQWNLTFQRAIGDDQAVSLAYVGARGEELFQNRLYRAGTNATLLGEIWTIAATGRSTYRALQVQYRGRLLTGLQGLASYAWATARETASNVGVIDRSDQLAPSSADLRHSFSAGASWMLPGVKRKAWSTITSDWGLNVLATARSGYPFSVFAGPFIVVGGERFQQRASRVPGVPVVLKDSSAPGGLRWNRAAFTRPPAGEQGDTGRNEFRGPAAFQLDMALERTIPVRSSIKVRLRVDAFNVFNTPVFALPIGNLSSGSFGVPVTSMSRGAEALYRPGGSRSVALTIRGEF